MCGKLKGRSATGGEHRRNSAPATVARFRRSPEAGFRRSSTTSSGDSISKRIFLTILSFEPKIYPIIFVIKRGILFSQWVVKGAIELDIGANPSAEGGGEDETVDDQAVKVVDIVDTFRLQVSSMLKTVNNMVLHAIYSLNERRFCTVSFPKNRDNLLLTRITIGSSVHEEAHQELGPEVGRFVGESMQDDGTVVTDPTFLYLAYGLKEAKC
ncbi:hypothetical protein Taro_004294 [Colocasia esculenta]|uniref:Uncharacterized protein n=1 Tax=Colocasia esculenta TaxID=4460 RepID=A0A843TR96_COLES|nr:hypothetical protein [Colocasia esculenta]